MASGAQRHRLIVQHYNMKHISLTTLTFLSMILTACSTFQPIDLPDCRTVQGVPGPEDFVLDDVTYGGRRPRLIVSSQERRRTDPNGEFLEPGTIYAVPLSRNGEFETPEAFTFVNRDDYPFHPHGFDLVESTEGLLLYVINHALQQSHSIEVYGVRRDELVFLRRLRSTLLVSPNDLLALPDGTLYISNDRLQTGLSGALCDYFAFGCGNVVHYSPAENLWRVAAADISFANGVEASEDRLFVAGTMDMGIHVYQRDAFTGRVGAKTAFYEIGSGVDNLIWEDETRLLVAAHPDIFAFLDHVEDENKHSPSEVYRVEAFTGRSQRIFADDGKLIDASATALMYAGRLFVSQVFDPEIVSCALPQ